MKTAIHLHRFLLAGGALALAACAAAPQPPSDAMQAAEIAITDADNDHAADAAPLEMRTAHEKLTAARANVAKGDEPSMAQARQQADEARVDAQLASSRSRLAKAEAVNQELQKNSNTLRQETQRGSGS